MTYQFLIAIPPTVFAIALGIVITLLLQHINPRQWSE